LWEGNSGEKRGRGKLKGGRVDNWKGPTPKTLEGRKGRTGTITKKEVN